MIVKQNLYSLQFSLNMSLALNLFLIGVLVRIPHEHRLLRYSHQYQPATEDESSLDSQSSPVLPSDLFIPSEAALSSSRTSLGLLWTSTPQPLSRARGWRSRMLWQRLHAALNVQSPTILIHGIKR